MFKRLYNLYLSETERTQLVVIAVISLICFLIYYPFSEAIWKSVVQFAVTGLIAYFYKSYLNKSTNHSQIQIWKFFYVLWLVIVMVSWVIA